LHQRAVATRSREIWSEFLGTEATCPVNIDSKSLEATRLAMDNPDRWTFDRAAVRRQLLICLINERKHLVVYKTSNLFVFRILHQMNVILIKLY